MLLKISVPTDYTPEITSIRKELSDKEWWLQYVQPSFCNIVCKYSRCTYYYSGMS